MNQEFVPIFEQKSFRQNRTTGLLDENKRTGKVYCDLRPANTTRLTLHKETCRNHGKLFSKGIVDAVAENDPRYLYKVHTCLKKLYSVCNNLQ